jgi:hypothetical protein
MLMRMYKLCAHKPTHSDAPTDNDLAPMKGKILGIKINEWQNNGKEGNYVGEVHALEGFVPAVGEKLVVSSGPTDGLGGYAASRVVSNDLLDNIAF